MLNRQVGSSKVSALQFWWCEGSLSTEAARRREGKGSCGVAKASHPSTRLLLRLLLRNLAGRALLPLLLSLLRVPWLRRQQPAAEVEIAGDFRAELIVGALPASGGDMSGAGVRAQRAPATRRGGGGSEGQELGSGEREARLVRGVRKVVHVVQRLAHVREDVAVVVALAIIVV